MWSTLRPASGSAIPCSRSKLAACVHDGHIYMLGGRNGNIPVKDFWKYNLTDHTWTEIRSTGDFPNNLQDHTMVGWKGRLYVFGGEVGFASTGETPLWIYDISTNHCRKLIRKGGIPQPQGCRGHTAVVHQGAMFIYGGYRDLKGSTNELWRFDFEEECWRLESHNGSAEVPPGRHNHSVVVHDSAMWVYGGMTDLQAKADFWKWDFTSRHWSRVRCKGGPGELHGHTAVKIMSSMVLFGGERSGQLQNEIWKFHFATDTWEKIVLSGSQPNPRSRHLAIVVPTLLLLLPHVYEKQREQVQHQQKQFTEQVFQPSFLPGISRGQTPPPVRLPKSETISNCREVAAIHEDSGGSGNWKITSSFSQTNFRYLKERISTSSLFKQCQNGSYAALSNSSESFQEDLESGDVWQQSPVSGVKRTTQSVYALPLLLDSNKGTGVKQSVSTPNPRFHGRTLFSVPNFQRIENQELRGLMEDLSDSSSVDVPTRCVPLNECHVENHPCPLSPPKNRKGDTIIVRTHNGRQRNLVLISGSKDRGGDIDGDRSWIAGVQSSTAPQDSLESIPDIKDFISPDSGTQKSFQEDSGSLKLIDLEADWNGVSEPPSPQVDISGAGINVRQGIPKSGSSLDGPKCWQTVLPVVQENAAWESHKDYASALNNKVTSPDGRRWSTLEMKTFPCITDFDEGISEDMFFEEDDPSPPDDHPLTEADVVNSKGENSSNIPKGTDDNIGISTSARHFSMLVLGGREQGLNGCGRQPITLWKVDFWK